MRGCSSDTALKAPQKLEYFTRLGVRSTRGPNAAGHRINGLVMSPQATRPADQKVRVARGSIGNDRRTDPIGLNACATILVRRSLWCRR